jgi:Zn finger protein HypA/HybF involved in hydrogenase expression
MKRLGKCPSCNVKPKERFVEVICGNCGKKELVLIDKGVVYDPRSVEPPKVKTKKNG